MSKTVEQQLFGSGLDDKIELIVNGGLRSNDVLQYEEWRELDEQLVEPARIPLRAFSDLMENGLVYNLGRDAYLSTMQLDWQTSTEIEAAVMTLDGATATDRDRPEFTTYNVPLPLTIKEFGFSMRNIRESRKLGRPLDVTTAQLATRQVAELLENTVVNGNSALKFKGNALEGYTNATNRMTDGFSNSHWGSGTPTGEQMLDDLL